MPNLKRNPLLPVLEKFGSQWHDQFDIVKVYDYGFGASLRMVKGSRDVTIIFDPHDHCLNIGASSMAHDETDVQWLTNLSTWGRPHISLEQFVEARYPDNFHRKRLLKNLRMIVDQNNMKKVVQYFDLHRDLIRDFIEDFLYCS